jgi:hypothetical protein
MHDIACYDPLQQAGVVEGLAALLASPAAPARSLAHGAAALKLLTAAEHAARRAFAGADGAGALCAVLSHAQPLRACCVGGSNTSLLDPSQEPVLAPAHAAPWGASDPWSTGGSLDTVSELPMDFPPNARLIALNYSRLRASLQIMRPGSGSFSRPPGAAGARRSAEYSSAGAGVFQDASQADRSLPAWAHDSPAGSVRPSLDLCTLPQPGEEDAAAAPQEPDLARQPAGGPGDEAARTQARYCAARIARHLALDADVALKAAARACLPALVHALQARAVHLPHRCMHALLPCDPGAPSMLHEAHKAAMPTCAHFLQYQPTKVHSLQPRGFPMHAQCLVSRMRPSGSPGLLAIPPLTVC